VVVGRWSGSRLGMPLADMNADGYDDAVVGAPGAVGSRPNSGTAFVVYGNPTPSNVNLGSLGGAGFSVTGSGGDNIGSSITGMGDFDGDGISDLALGGHGAFIVTGVDGVRTATIDLSQDLARITRVSEPAAAGSSLSLVSGSSDLNADGLNDLLISYPGNSSVYTVFTQDGMRDLISHTLALDSAGAQSVARYVASATGDGNGSAIDSGADLGGGQAGSIVGAWSGARRASGLGV
jgi:hypothetical protein